MKAVIAILFAVVLMTEGKVAPSSPSNTTPQDTFQLSEFITQAQTNINNLGREIQERLNLPNQETVVEAVKEQSTNFVNNVQAYVNNVTEEVKNKSPELERLWTDVKGKLDKVVEDITSKIPNAREQANDLQAKFQEGVQVLVKESDNAAKSISQNSGKLQEDIAKFTKQAVEIAVQATQNLNTHLQQAAAPKS